MADVTGIQGIGRLPEIGGTQAKRGAGAEFADALEDAAIDASMMLVPQR